MSTVCGISQKQICWSLNKGEKTPEHVAQDRVDVEALQLEVHVGLHQAHIGEEEEEEGLDAAND